MKLAANYFKLCRCSLIVKSWSYGPWDSGIESIQWHQIIIYDLLVQSREYLVLRDAGIESCTGHQSLGSGRKTINHPNLCTLP